MNPLRLIVLGDTHCGSVSGLTPPSFEKIPADKDSQEYQWYEWRRWLYSSFKRDIEKYGPFDVAIFNGDLVDGDQSKARGLELVETDRLQQAEMAKHIVRQVDATKNYFTHGTGYHTGMEEDFESLVAEEFDGNIRQEQFVEIKGLVVHAMHHASGSSLAHTRQNALGREIVEMIMRRDKGDILQKPEILFRNHLHYGGSVEDHGIKAIRVPALQLPNGSKWARRFAPGKLDFGFVIVDIWGPGNKRSEFITWAMPPKIMESIDEESLARERRKKRLEILQAETKYKTPVPIPSGRVGS